MIKKSIAIILILTITLIMASCSSNQGASNTSENSNNKKVLTVWTWDANFNGATIEEAKAIFKKDNPDVEINIVDFSREEVEQKLHTNLASGLHKGLPDIVLIEDYSAQKYLQSYPGAFADLTTAIDYTNFAPYKSEIMTLDGKRYGVPFDTGVTGMYYRRDLYEEAGFTGEDLQDITWERFIEIGKIIKEKTGKYVITIEPGGSGLLRAIMQSNGDWYFDANGNVNILENKSLRRAIEIHKEIVDSKIGKVITGWTEFVGSFNGEEVASNLCGAWITPSVMAEESHFGKWGIAKPPKLEGGSNSSNMGGSSWYVLESSENKDTAIEFMNKTFASDMNFYQSILTNIGAIGTYLPAGEGEAYTTPNDFFGGQKIYQDFSNWNKDIPPVNYGIYTSEADSIAMAEIASVIAGNITVDRAIENIDKQLRLQIQ